MHMPGDFFKQFVNKHMIECKKRVNSYSTLTSIADHSKIQNKHNGPFILYLP